MSNMEHAKFLARMTNIAQMAADTAKEYAEKNSIDFDLNINVSVRSDDDGGDEWESSSSPGHWDYEGGEDWNSSDAYC